MIRRAMGMISCDEAMRRLWEFLDAELGPEEEAEVQRHLEVCEKCYPQYDFQRAYFRFMHRVAEGERATPAFRRRLFRRLLEAQSAEEDRNE
ncbi:MAG: zf-HC2 domain-containing protein [Gemmatimonadota bacterium]